MFTCYIQTDSPMTAPSPSPSCRRPQGPHLPQPHPLALSPSQAAAHYGDYRTAHRSNIGLCTITELVGQVHGVCRTGTCVQLHIEVLICGRSLTGPVSALLCCSPLFLEMISSLEPFLIVLGQPSPAPIHPCSVIQNLSRKLW